jgi:TRAP-type C4-dicarboxylate transport system permease large subunit
VIVLPMVKTAGLDLVWFGVYLVIHVEMAQITPPVGFNLFVLQNMSGRDTFTVRARRISVFPAAAWSRYSSSPNTRRSCCSAETRFSGLTA